MLFGVTPHRPRRHSHSSASVQKVKQKLVPKVRSGKNTNENDHHREYDSLQEQNDRILRFPSIDDRVRLYMTSWYVPPCEDEDKIQYNYQVEDADEQNNNKQQEKVSSVATLGSQKLFVREAPSLIAHDPRLFELKGIVMTNSSTIFYLDEAALKNCHLQVCKDVFHHVVPYIMPKRKPLRGWVVPPTLLDLGDKEVSVAYQPKEDFRGVNPTLPRIKKFRLAFSKDDVALLTARECMGGPRDGDLAKSSVGIQHVQPIVWKLKSKMHFGMLANVSQWDIPYEKKKDKAVFRGRLSGIHKVSASVYCCVIAGYLRGTVADEHPYFQEGLTAQEHQDKDLSSHDMCMQIPRCRLVLKNCHSPRIDARLVGPRKRLPASIPTDLNATAASDWRVQRQHECNVFADDRMSIQEMLQYKAIVLMEGNDVSAGLKWALYSNSLVLMEPITVTSWAMEERLQPWVHFVPINANGDNVDMQFQWVLDNPKAAQQIARNGALWIKDLFFHPDAESDEKSIFAEMMRRYQAQFVPNSLLF